MIIKIKRALDHLSVAHNVKIILIHQNFKFSSRKKVLFIIKTHKTLISQTFKATLKFNLKNYKLILIKNVCLMGDIKTKHMKMQYIMSPLLAGFRYYH